MMRKLHGLVVAAITFAAGVSFVTLVVTYSIAGGDPTGGFERAGHFYVWNKPHTSYQEVSQIVWQLSHLANRAILVLWPAGFIAQGSWLLSKASWALNGTSLREADSRVRFVRRSGAPLCSRRLSGSCGRVSVSGPLFLVDVYPGGAVVKPCFGGPHAILASEIQEVAAESPGLGIYHTGAGMPSPLTLRESFEAPLGAAIRTIAQGPDGWKHPILPTEKPARSPRLRFWVTLNRRDASSADQGKPQVRAAARRPADRIWTDDPEAPARRQRRRPFG
jgi:hypothetical protein